MTFGIENKKEELFKEVRKSIRKEKNRKNAAKTITLITIISFFITGILIVTNLFKLMKVTEDYGKIEKVSLIQGSSLKQMPLDKAGYYLTYKIEVSFSSIIDDEQWNLFLSTVPKELRKKDNERQMFIIAGMTEKDEAFLLRNKLEAYNIIQRGTIEIKKPVIGWR